MTHREKIAHFERDLEARGFWKSNALPPLFRLLWALGVEVPPPYFLLPRQAFLIAGLPFGLLSAAAFGLFMWLFEIGTPSLRLNVVGFTALAGVFAFGLSMAKIWSWQGDKLELPPWPDYPLDGSSGG